MSMTAEQVTDLKNGWQFKLCEFASHADIKYYENWVQNRVAMRDRLEL
jgi:hypothetical protein